MKSAICILLLITNAGRYCYSQQKGAPNHLFRIIDHEKTGFIDSTGRIIIRPLFLAASDFSENLASARLLGTYGYIDKQGNFAVSPQYDYATDFNDGLAIVYKGGKPFFINKKGEQPFACNYKNITQFENNRAIVKTYSGKFGAIDKKGNLLVDTAYLRLGLFKDGLSIVYSLNHHEYDDSAKGIKKNIEVGLIDTDGKFVVPYHQFLNIDDYSEGYYRAVVPFSNTDSNGKNYRNVIIDSKGHIIISIEEKNNCFLSGNFHCGLAKMYLYKYWIPEEKGILSSSDKSYEGFVNSKGEVAINDTNFEYVEDFSENRAFVQDLKRQHLLLNTQGKIISKPYDRVLGNSFKNGVAFVEVDNKWGLIDSDANFIFQPKFDEIEDPGMIDNYFFFKDYSKKLIGVASKDGTIIIPPIMQEFNYSGFNNGLLACAVNNKQTYINWFGKIIWQEDKTRQSKLSDFNIDFMNRGYFYAYSLPGQKEAGLGGYGRSRNTPRKIVIPDYSKPNILSLVVDTQIIDTFSDLYYGYPVYITNKSKTNTIFNAQDSRLYMQVEALDEKGQWKEIEYLPSSWCGNSYHTLTLPSKYYWKFTMPRYKGDFETKLRVKLKCVDPTDKTGNYRNKKELTLYSNEFTGNVNPGQFWRKREYFPNGLMDPYND